MHLPTESPTWLTYARTFGRDVQLIVARPVWARVCVAYTLYVAVIGVYAYW